MTIDNQVNMQIVENKNIARKPVLVVIYNHHYPDNVAKIEHIYGERFSRIHHLMPFYEKRRDPNPANHKFNIIPVYDNSHYHQSFIANGFSHYYHQDASHYIFIADDLMLNPQINENNYQKFFNLTPDSAYIEEVQNLPNAYSLLPWKEESLFHHSKSIKSGKSHSSPFSHLISALKNDLKRQWHHSISAYNFSLDSAGLHWPPQLVNHIEAMQRLKQNNLLIDHIDIKKGVWIFNKWIKSSRRFIKKKHMLRAILEYWIKGKDSYRPHSLAYPLACGYSDIFIIPSNRMDRFSTHCGFFAAHNLFVEIAIPTSIVLTNDAIVQASTLKHRTFNYIGSNKISPLKDKYTSDLQLINKHWPADYAYIHQLKLSGLKV